MYTFLIHPEDENGNEIDVSFVDVKVASCDEREACRKAAEKIKENAVMDGYSVGITEDENYVYVHLDKENKTKDISLWAQELEEEI